MGGGLSNRKAYDVTSRYKFSDADIIGRGAGSVVYKATLLEHGRKAMDDETLIPSVVAIKVIYSTNLIANSGQVMQEKDVLIKLRHRFMVSVFEYFEVGNVQYIVMEYLAGGSISRMISEEGPISELKAARIIAQVSSFIAFCSLRGYAYRDLRADNILFTSEDSCSIRVINFGLTCPVYENSSKRKLNTVCGSPQYVAPEVMMRQYDCSADAWSIGVLLYYMLSGQFPFSTDDFYTKRKSTAIGKADGSLSFHNPCWRAVSADAKALIRKLLTENPSDRLASCEIARDPWMVRFTTTRDSSERESWSGSSPELLEENTRSLANFMHRMDSKSASDFSQFMVSKSAQELLQTSSLLVR